MERGEIRWYRFSPPDKNRPVLLLTRDSVLGSLDQVTVATITTTIRDIPTEVLLTEEDGLPRTCVVNLDQIHTVSKSKIGALIATFPESRMLEIRRALLFALGFKG